MKQWLRSINYVFAYGCLAFALGWTGGWWSGIFPWGSYAVAGAAFFVAFYNERRATREYRRRAQAAFDLLVERAESARRNLGETDASD